jgi:hypothetical protein
MMVIGKPGGGKSFSKYPLTLSGSFYEIREYFDFIDVDIVHTTADTSKVYVYIDDDPIPFRLSDITGTFVIGNKLKVTWEPSETNKVLVLVLGKEYRYFTYRGWFTLGRETIGLMDTLQSIKSKTDKLNYDLYDYLRVNLANAEVILPVEVQSNYKHSFTIYSGTVTANGNTNDIDVESYSALELQVKVTAVSGTTPALSVYIEGKFDTTGDYKPLVYQENISSTGIYHFTITQLIFKTIRVRWSVSGTSPSFTFSVDAVGKA